MGETKQVLNIELYLYLNGFKLNVQDCQINTFLRFAE